MKHKYFSPNGISEHELELYSYYKQEDSEYMDARWRDFSKNVIFGTITEKVLAEKMLKYGYMSANFRSSDETTEENPESN